MKRYRIGDATVCAVGLGTIGGGAPHAEAVRLAEGRATLADAERLLRWIEGSPAAWGDAPESLTERSAVSRTIRKLRGMISAERERIARAVLALPDAPRGW